MGIDRMGLFLLWHCGLVWVIFLREGEHEASSYSCCLMNASASTSINMSGLINPLTSTIAVTGGCSPKNS